ncbi:MAG: TetR/AcrR family transcriptional regulator [Pseudomonadota bacterium]
MSPHSKGAPLSICPLQRAAENAKPKYHHGDLRQTLVETAYDLVRENGAEHFSLADACRRAGVSTAAPYKHFRDRNEVLELVTQRAFLELTDASMEAVKTAGGPQTLAGMQALFASYITFAMGNQALFRLMFGQHPELKKAEPVLGCGQSCFEQVVTHVATYCAATGITEDSKLVTVRAWTFVHGLACLLMDEDYEAVAPDLDHQALLRDTLPRLLHAKP